MEQWYFINQQGVQQGPFPLMQLYGRGITPDTYVWHEGLPNWLAARDVPAMAPILQGQPPMAQPQQPTYGYVNPSMNPAMQPGYNPPTYAVNAQPGTAVYNEGYTIKDLPSADQVEQKFRVFSIFYWAQIVLWIGCAVAWILFENEPFYYEYDYYTEDYSYNDSYYDEYLMATWILLFTALLAGAISIIFRMQIIYYGFKSITDKYFRPRATPSSAVGLLFVPFYYIYQRFISYKGLGEEMNRYISYRYFKPFQVNTGTLQGVCVVGIISVVPYVGSLGWLVMIPFRFLAIRTLKRGLVHILQERTMQDEV